MLIWEKPTPILSKEEWKEEQDHPEHPTYRPNMSDEDATKWRARIFPKANPPRVEIRKSCSLDNYCMMKIVVRARPEFIPNQTGRRNHTLPPRIDISMNGTMQLTMREWTDMMKGILEAVETLEDISFSPTQ